MVSTLSPPILLSTPITPLDIPHLHLYIISNWHTWLSSHENFLLPPKLLVPKSTCLNIIPDIISSATSFMTTFPFPLAFFNAWQVNHPSIFNFDDDMTGNHVPIQGTCWELNQITSAKISIKRQIAFTSGHQLFILILHLSQLCFWHSQPHNSVSIIPFQPLYTLLTFPFSQPNYTPLKGLKTLAIVALAVRNF